MNKNLVLILTLSILLLAACQPAPEMQACYANHDPPVLQSLRP